MNSFKMLVFKSFNFSLMGLIASVVSFDIISFDKHFPFAIEAIFPLKRIFDKIIIFEKCILLEKKFKDFIELILELKYFIEFLLFAMFL